MGILGFTSKSSGSLNCWLVYNVSGRLTARGLCCRDVTVFQGLSNFSGEYNIILTSGSYGQRAIKTGQSLKTLFRKRTNCEDEHKTMNMSLS